MDAPLQIADAFSVNDSHLKNSALATGFEVVRNQIANLARLERVQIKNSVHWKFHRLVLIKLVIHPTFSRRVMLSSRKAGRTFSDAPSFPR